MAEPNTPNPDETAAARFFYDAHVSDDVAVGSTVFLTSGAVNFLKDNGLLVQINRDELEPSAAKNPTLKTALARNIPMFVVPGVGVVDSNAKIVPLGKGQQIALVDENLHKWNETYVREHIMPSDAAIAQNSALLSPDDYLKKLQENTADPQKFADMKRRFDSIIGEANREIQSRNIEPPPTILINTGTQTGAERGANAATSQEGKNYLILGSNLLEDIALTSDRAAEGYRGIVGHELTHLEKQHITVAGILSAKENKSIARFMESEADYVGSGPRGSGNPVATAEFLKDYLAYRYPDYASVKHVKPADKPTDKDLQRVSEWLKEKDPVHATVWDRIVALQYEAGLMERDRDNPVAKGDPQRESDTIVGRVRQYMNRRMELPETDPLLAKTPPKPRPHSELPDPNKRAESDVVQLAALTQSPDIKAIQETMAQLGAQPLDRPRAPDGVQRKAQDSQQLS